MKKLILIAAFMVLLLTGYPQWFRHNSIPVSTDLDRITFIDSFHGWILGDSGTILHTSDGGGTWEIQHCPAGAEFGDICMIDSLNGWIVGHGPDTSGCILKTSDGGANWILQDISPHYLWDVCFTDSLHGWIIGDAEERMPCMLRSTVDGGATWSEAFIPDVMLPYDVIFTDTMTGFIGGSYHNGSDLCSRIIKTTDGGATWQVKLDYCSDPFSFYKGLAFVNDSVGWLTGENWIDGNQGFSLELGFIKATQDGGETWHKIFSGEIYPSDACPTSDQSGWAVGGHGFFMYTGDGGDHWEMMTFPPEEYLNDIIFINVDTGWAVGANGTVMYTYNNGTMGVPEAQADISGLKIAPNPVKEEFTVSFNLEKGGRIKAELVDLSGRSIALLFDKKLDAGPNRLTCHPAQGISPGLYFLRIISPSGKITGKIIVD